MATKTKAQKKRAPAKTGSYRWRAGSRFPVKASVAAAELARIRRSSGGSVTPANVVDAARDPDHPLHPCFEWDDTSAAERWRQQQARVLINSVRVVVEEVKGPAQQVAFVSVNVRDQGRAYLPTSVVMSDDEYRAESLADALAALQGWRQRYRHLSELAEVFAVIDAVQKKKAA